MANGTEEVDVKTPRGTVTVRVPSGMSDADIAAHLRQRQPELFSLKQRLDEGRYVPDEDVIYTPLKKLMADPYQHGMKRARDPAGNIYEAPADEPLPAGWTLEGEPYQRGLMAHAGRSLKNIVRGIPQTLLASTNPAYSANQAADMASQWEAEKAEGRGLPYRLAAQVARAVGVNVPGMEEAAAQGDPSGVLGEAVVPAALATAPLVGEGIGRGIGATGRATARFARDPVTGALKPGVRKAATVGGALAGGGMGGRFLEGEWRAPGALFGAHYGSRLAPRLLDAIIPDLPEGAVAARPTPPPAGLPEAAAPVSGTPSESPLVIPEPYRPRILAESTPRENLLDLARGGYEGAGEQMGRLGQPVIYISRGADVPIESLGRPTPFSEPRLVDAIRLARNKSKILGMGYK